MRPAKRVTSRPVRNPFYPAVARGGIRIVTPVAAPSPISERPVTNPYYERVMKDGGVRLRIPSGRACRGEAGGATETKLVRLAPGIWKRLEAQAEREGMSRHAAIRQAVLIWLRS
jgi:hypothetical protein